MGAVLSIARRRRMGEFFSVMAVLAVVAFRFMPNGILWNNRILPFWFLLLYLLGGLAVAELYTMFAERMTGYTVTLRALSLPGPLLVLILSLIWVGFPLRVLPGEHVVAGGNYEFLGIPQKASRISRAGSRGTTAATRPGVAPPALRCPPTPPVAPSPDGPSTPRSWPRWTSFPRHTGVDPWTGSTSPR